MYTIIDGKATSAALREEIKNKVEARKANGERIPGLAVIIVGEDPASQVYVRNKHKACEEVGFLSRIYRLPAETQEDELVSLVKDLNQDEAIDGILVQLPLPKHLDDKAVIAHIDPAKDVDAFHTFNVGKIMLGEPGNTLCDKCQEYFKKVFDVCKSYKKSCGIYCNDENAANVYKKLGAEVFWFSMDLNFLLLGYNEIFDGIKNLF